MATNVFVKARDATRPTVWDVGFNSPPPQGKVPINVGQGSGPEDIIFHLLGTPGMNADFDPTDPIWVTSSGTARRKADSIRKLPSLRNRRTC